MKKKVFKFKKGFTLIEVIIAISMVVILASLSVPKITGYLDKAKVSNAISKGKQIYTAAMWSYTENGCKFVDTGVFSAIQDTTSIEGFPITATVKDLITVGSNSKKVSVSFTSNSKDYLVEIDGDNNSYTIKKGKTSSDPQIFSSIQDVQ
jgi:type IV pilus assembly protein PilA